MEELTPPPETASKMKIVLYILIVALIAVYTFISCSSLRHIYHHCEPNGGCTTYVYDSTIITKIP